MLKELGITSMLFMLLTHVCIIAASSIAIDCRKRLGEDRESKIPFLIVVITLSCLCVLLSIVLGILYMRSG